MGAFVRSLTAAFFISLGASAATWAQDRPIDGQRLVLKRTGTSTKLTFVSRDPDFLFPVIGTGDDPSIDGLTVEVFSLGEGEGSLAAPLGVGNPGWTVASAPPLFYRFRNGEAPAGISPLRLALLRQGRTLKIVAKDAGLPLAAPLGAVGIRITTGNTLRNCARFAGPTVRKDEAGAFVGSHATADAIVDCSDASMNGLPPACEVSGSPACGGTCSGDGVCTATLSGCVCISPSSACGDTAPACSGTCPAGEECAAVGPGPFPGCVCLPTGSTPCGSPGAPVCGGACPSGLSCEPVRSLPIFGGYLGCECRSPGPCGFGGADCPNGFACAAMNPRASCTPIDCGGNPAYPTCGGSCVSGAACQAVKVGPTSPSTFCLCAIPAPCDVACGSGYACPSGDVCTVDNSSLSCSCGAP